MSDSALLGALGSQLLDYFAPDASSSVGNFFGAEGDNASTLGNSLIGAGLGYLGSRNARGALAGGLGAYTAGGGGKTVGDMMGLSGKNSTLVGNALLGAGAGKLSGAGAGTGAAAGSALALLAKNGDSNLFRSMMSHPAATPSTAPGASPNTPPVDPTQPGGIQGGLDAVTKFIREHPTVSAALLMAMTNKGRQPMQAQPIPLPAQFTQTATATPTAARHVVPLGGSDHYYTYGQAPEHVWTGADSTPQFSQSAYADGGEVVAPHGLSGLQSLSQGSVGHVQGPGDGRDDYIPAKLSNDEYIMDAETMALLGNGSPAAGAKKLDKLRANVRAHKGRALARGKISPDAHEDAETYLGGK